MSQVNLGEVANDQGDQTLARSMFEDSLGILRELGDRTVSPSHSSTWDELAHYQRDFATARSLLEQSLAMLRTWGRDAGSPYHLSIREKWHRTRVTS